MKKTLRGLAAVVVSVVCLFGGNLYPVDVVCRMPAIAGYDEAATRAKQHLGSVTTSLRKMEVYVTVEHDSLYIHSNYQTAGSEFPTKLATDSSDWDMPNLTYNLVGEVSQFDLLSAIRRDITYHVDQRLFTKSKYRNLDFGEAERVRVIDSSGKAYNSRPLYKEDGSTERIVEYGEGLYVRATNGNLAQLANNLAAQPFSRDDIGILSLTQNTDTVNRVDELFSSAQRVDFDFSSAEALRNQLSKHSGKTVFAVGHVEEGSFVVLDAAGKESFRMPIDHIEALGSELNVKVIPVGCHSARSTASIGVETQFNTVDAVEKIHSAAERSRTYGEFVDKMASEDFVFVIDETVTHGSREHVRIRIYPTVGTAAIFGAAIATMSIDIDDDDNGNTIWYFTGVVVLVVGSGAVYLSRRSAPDLPEQAA